MAILLNEVPGNDNTISRTIGTSAGASYTLTFKYWGDNLPYGAPLYATYSFQVSVNGSATSYNNIQNPGLATTPDNSDNGRYSTGSITFTASGGSTTISFKETTPVNYASVIVDDIVVVQNSSGSSTVFSETFNSTVTGTSYGPDSSQRSTGEYTAIAALPSGWATNNQGGVFAFRFGTNIAILLNEVPGNDNQIYRNIGGLTSGRTYRLTFRYWGDNRTTPNYAFQVSINGNVTSFPSVSSPGLAPGVTLDDGTSNLANIDFTASGTVATIMFTETTPVGETSVIIDDVSVADLGGGSGGDTTPPVLTSLNVTAVANSAIVRWNTDDLSTTEVRFGTVQGLYPNTSGIDGTLVFPHSGQVSTLLPNTQYFFQAKSVNSAGLTGTTTGSFRTIPAPVILPAVSRLEVNLGYMPISEYYYGRVNDGEIAPGCPYGADIRQCFRNAFQSYRDQRVTGVRFMFGLCGGAHSLALDNCDTTSPTPVAAWDQRLRDLFQDLREFSIQNVTLTPLLHGAPNDKGAKWRRNGNQGFFTLQDDPCRPPPIAPATQQFPLTPVESWPASPYLVVPEANGSFEHGPHLGWFSASYNCSPPNMPTGQSQPGASPGQGLVGTFIGWDRIYSVFDRALAAAQGRVTVQEFDLTNEVALDVFTVQARLIRDNTHLNQLGLPEPVLESVRGLMLARGFDPLRVTVSTTTANLSVDPNKSVTIPPPSFDCGSPYGDSARLFRASGILAAFGGGLFGLPSRRFLANGAADLDYDYGLVCLNNVPEGSNPPPKNNNYNNMVTTGYALQQFPNIIDIHASPRIDGVDDLDLPNTTLMAQTHFNAMKSLMNTFCPGGWRSPIPNLCNALMMLGETAVYKVNPATGKHCDDSPLNVPFGTAQGIRDSALAGHPGQIVFRPWVDNREPCYDLPHNLSVVVRPNP